MNRIYSIAFASALLWCPFSAAAEEQHPLEAKSHLDQRIATSVFDRVESGFLLSGSGPWIAPKVRGGPGIRTSERLLFLDDIAFTAKIICNLGEEGLSECYRRLDGESQSARIVAIYALQMAFGFEDTLVVQAPMVGLHDGKPRDLSATEIRELKDRYRAKIDELREQSQK